MVYFNLTENQNPISLHGLMTVIKKFTLGQRVGFGRRRDFI